MQAANVDSTDMGHNVTGLANAFSRILDELRVQVEEFYGERLVTLAVFGSVSKGTMRPDSDIDLMLIVRDLPRGRMARVEEFNAIEARLEPVMNSAGKKGIHTTLSPVIKTPEEVAHGSLLFLDMTEQVRILVDRSDFFQAYLAGFRARLGALGARKIRLRGGYYWLLKPDQKPGEDIAL